MFREINKNPYGKRVGDCVIRALSVALNQSWEKTYVELCIQGYMMADMPSSNRVWGEYLRCKGFVCNVMMNDCFECTVAEFARKHDKGIYILGTGTHVVAVENGAYIDTWDSGNEVPIYYWEAE